MFTPLNEQGVIVLFAMLAKDAGWEFVHIGAAFPDAVLSKDDEQWIVEFEYKASNFLDHKHDHRQCDMIVCWENDYTDCPLPVIALNNPDGVNAHHVKCDPQTKEIEYWKRRATLAEYRTKVLSREIKEIKEVQDARLKRSIQLEPDTIDRMLEIYKVNPKASLRQVGNTVGLSHTGVSKALDKLEAQKRIHRNGHGVEVLS